MKDKKTEEQAKLYAALLWEELCKPRHYGKRKKKEDIKESAIQTLIDQGVLPDLATEWDCLCPYCELWDDAGECHECPMQQFADEYEYVACTKYGPYKHWGYHPCPATARAMADFCWSVYRGQDGGDKERKACACCKDEKSKAVRFEVGDRIKLLDTASGSSADRMNSYPKWNNTRVAGTVTRECCGGAAVVYVRWDNGIETAMHTKYADHLTHAERLMLARRPIRPGDVFKYWNDEELRTLVVVSDGSDSEEFYFLDITDPDSPFVATDPFSPGSDTRGVEDVVYYHHSPRGYNVYFEGLVPVGRMMWSVEPKA